VLVFGFCEIGIVKGFEVWGAIYLVETGLELGQDVCHDFIAEGVDSRRSVRLWDAIVVAFTTGWTVELQWRFCSLKDLRYARVDA